MKTAHNYIGETFGDLTIIAKGKILPSRHRTWVCKCICGTELEVAYPSLKQGRTRSCGCLRQRNTHNMSENSSIATPQEIRTYKIWKGIKYRCTNNEKNYGARGIGICTRWAEFPNFLEDMGLCPEGYSIERIDVNGHYEPNNCKWIPLVEQSLNKRNTKKVMYNGEEVPLKTLCDNLGLSYGTVYQRIYTYGMSLDHALEPVDRRTKEHKLD